MFRFLRDTNAQANTLTLYTRNLNRATKIFVAKTQQEAFSQTIVFLSKVMYVSKIRVNYFERFSIIKQKTINKTNKLRKVVDVTIRVIVMQYKQEIVDKNVYAIEKEIIVARTTLQKIDAKIDKYIELERQVNALIQENKRLAKKENRVYETCIDRDLMQSL